MKTTLRFAIAVWFALFSLHGLAQWWPATSCTSFNWEASANDGITFSPTYPYYQQFGGTPHWTFDLPTGNAIEVNQVNATLSASTLTDIGLNGANICFTWSEGNQDCFDTTCYSIVYWYQTAQILPAEMLECAASFEATIGENGHVTFLNTSSGGNENTVFEWNVGDGTPLIDSENAEHNYNTSGPHEVCLTMSTYSGDQLICTSEYCETINIELPILECEPGSYPVTVEITTCCEAEYPNFAVFSFWNENELGFFQDIDLPQFAANSSQQFCLEEGCYSVQFDYSLMNQAAQQIASMSLSSPNTTFYSEDELWEGLFWNLTLCVGPNDDPCTFDITATQTECGVYAFEVSNFPEMGNIVWSFGDGQESGGTNGVTHTYTEADVYVVCATVWTGECPNGVEVCTEVEVESCDGSECPSAIVAQQTGCGSYHFHIDDVDTGEVTWNFDDGTSLNGGVNSEHIYQSNGVWIVTAVYYGINCPEGITLIYTMNVDCIDTDNCPDQIWSNAGNDCGVMNFEIGSFVEGESVTWYPGDESGLVVGGHFFSHQYEEPGTYNVCAFYTSPACPDGVELCTTIYVESCSTGSCPTYLSGTAIDCDSYVFHVDNAPQGNVIWDFGDESTETSGIEADHTYLENGVYFVTATYTGQDCPNGTTLYFTVLVECETTNDCPDQIWSGAGEDCGMFMFEAGSFVEGESVSWNFGDGQVEIGGHYITHQYDEPGTYLVCCVVTNINCPGYTLCTEIVVSPCDEPCNELVLGIDCYVSGDASTNFAYSIMNAQTNEMVLYGTTPEYNANDPYFDLPVCLADGCYLLTIDNSYPITLGENVFLFLNVNGENVFENAEIIFADDISFQVMFGVNSSCSEEPECEASFTPIITNTPGHVEFINNSTYDGTASFIWTYGNDETSDGQSGNVWYDYNGVYEVCLTITTDNCSDTYCYPVSIQNMTTGCQETLVTVSIEANYPENLNELVDIVLLYEGIEYNTWPLPLFDGFSTTIDVCIPDGCYELDLSTDVPSVAENVSASITIGGETIDVIEFVEGNTESSVMFGVNSDCTIGIEEPTGHYLVYPNPASSQLMIVSENQDKVGQVYLYDLAGNLVFAATPQNNVLAVDVSNIAPGIYLAKLTGENSSEVRRIEIIR